MQQGLSLIPAAARRLAGKVAVITGGASGIGECTARLFSRHGAKVLIADVQDAKALSLCREIGPDTASFVHCDVSDESQVSAAVDAAVSTYGALDIMFNNAGTLGDMRGREILHADRAELDRVLATNVVGTFLGTKHAARVMMPRGEGSIIMTASVSSVLGGVANYPYTCSKHAVLGLVRDAAAELGKHGIRVNCVSPYGVATPMSTIYGMTVEQVEEMVAESANLKGRKLKAEDVADAVLYLASDESRYVSGLNLLVDGGLTIV